MSSLIPGNFYFVSDEYFQRFPDPFLMPNKGVGHNRPCFFAFCDVHTGLYWMIPISSKVVKYHKIAESKVQKYGYCNTIIFGQVLGQDRAFLIQNMFPVTDEYIDSQYIDSHSGAHVRVAKALSKQVSSSAKSALARQRHGAKLIFPDVLEIERQLLR